MLAHILDLSIRHRWLVLLATLLMALLGVRNYRHLPIDAVPDITNVQVQINTEAPGYSPLEVEQRITFPVESRVVATSAYSRPLRAILALTIPTPFAASIAAGSFSISNPSLSTASFST